MRNFINNLKHRYITYKRQKFMHERLMAKLDALTDPTLIDRMIAGEL